MTAGIETQLEVQLDRMDRARDARIARPTVRETHITLSHGSGGKATHQLLAGLVFPAFDNPMLDGVADAAVVRAPGEAGGRIAFTTDTYVVSPLFFPGGDIGRLAVNGTVNDLAMAGAEPVALSVAFVLEEGLPMDVFRRVVESIAAAAREANVPVTTGDTKVVPRGKADGVFVNTSGVGEVRRDVSLHASRVRVGDIVLVSGYIGDHGMAVMLAREALELEAEIRSDTAPLHTLAAAVLEAAPRTRVLKDPTRGGLATSLNEIAQCAGVAVALDEAAIPVRDEVRGACEILGIDPLHIANEGKLVAIVPPDEAGAALAALRAHPLGAHSRRVGEVLEVPARMVVLRTAIGGTRVLDMLVGDPLPRIC